MFLPVCTAGVLIRAAACKIPESLQTSGRIENQAGRAAVKILTTKNDIVCVLIIIYGKSTAVQLASCRVEYLNGYFTCSYFKDFFVHYCTSAK